MPAATQSTQQPVELEGTSEFNETLSVSLSDLDARQVKAEIPGEVSGPAVVFTLRLDNASSRDVDLDTLVVNVLDAKNVPASRITTEPATPVPAAIVGGGSARIRYAFVVPERARNPITVEVSLSAEDPALVFRGRVR